MPKTAKKKTESTRGATDLGPLPEWDLTDLYPAPDSPELKADLDKAAQKAKAFRKSYEGRPVPGVPYDADRGVIANVDGRLIDPSTGVPLPGQYCVGWARSGAKGLIAMHRGASAEVVARMLEDVATHGVDQAPRGSGMEMAQRLEARGVQYVTFGEWEAIDQAEIERGRARGAPRSKFVEIPQMLDIAEMKRRGW